MQDVSNTEVISSAEFKSSVIIYSWILTNIALLSTVIGILVMFIWIPFGWFVHLKQFQNTSCQLTERGIKIRKGWIFKAQQNIPLDKLTDISIHEGPILNIFGIVRISIETAGATPFTLVGLNKSTTSQFRDIVMKQRDILSGSQIVKVKGEQSNDVLIEIRDILSQINTKLSNQDHQ